VFRLPLRYSLIVTALAMVIVVAFLVVVLDLFGHIARGDPLSLASGLVGDLLILVVVMIVVALVISALTWGYWLGDLGGARGRGNDRSEEARAALEVLEKKYAMKEITMSEYLALRKGIERDRPRY
jgi:uncharacterized membrane protein